jgi:hypothetical protein
VFSLRISSSLVDVGFTVVPFGRPRGLDVVAVAVFPEFSFAAAFGFLPALFFGASD